ncbi:MAG TPA: hypothetical protein VJV79_10075 [Polyangiaceae bacterium]|nr:hypothetical protein [Polyangiaceae bacterium]
MELTLDDSENVKLARLSLARAWVGNERTLSPFATDIIASFVKEFSPEADREQAALFVQAIRATHGSNYRVIALNNDAPAPGIVPPDVNDFVAVLRGSTTDFASEMEQARLQATNLVNPAILGLSIEGLKPLKPPQEARGPLLDEPEHGGTLRQQAAVTAAVFGQAPVILVNETYLELEPELRRFALPAAALIQSIELVLICSPAEKSMVQLVVYDGRTAHSINAVSTDDSLAHVTYFDPWGKGSFLQKQNNEAGIDVTQSAANARLWIIDTSELQRIVYGAILVPEDWKNVEAVIGELAEPQRAVQKKLTLQRQTPAAHLAQAGTWQRLAKILGLQKRAKEEAAALLVAQALARRSQH